MRYLLLTLVLSTVVLEGCTVQQVPTITQIDDTPAGSQPNVHLGPRPFMLIEAMPQSELKDKLMSCANADFKPHVFSIGHRGAPMQFPEHTKESYIAAARMGAGVLECDVTFTADNELVCRHSQCDLHTTTNILATDLAAKCSEPFSPAANGEPARARCCTSDITVEEFKSLKGKMDGANPQATTVAQYLEGTPNWRTNLYSTHGTLMTHAQSIALFTQLGVRMTPELKEPEVAMPHKGMNQQDYAAKMLDEYKQAGVTSTRVWPQSFNYHDIMYWIEHHPEFAARSVYLDGRDQIAGFDPTNASTWSPSMDELVADGVQIIAPPIWMLLSLDDNGEIIPSAYAVAAKHAGLKIITWSLERSGPLHSGGGWYYKSISDAVVNDGVMMRVLDVLAQDVGVIAVFSDWPATTTYYANCMLSTD
ncbi:glycerophosphodiester phosphodiesterase family protein [Pseudoalteromonas pernae]|uniref:glycerophosphodiester phosphodiesterase family protein n=1 Tax=Pseudoalteromonas pernae TaxID=3118054 RepID=UPI003F801C1F